MRWYEYKMEVDDLHASEDLKAKLLAMQAKAADTSSTTAQPQTTAAPAASPAVPTPAVKGPAKKPPIRFPWKRAAQLTACAAVCGLCLYGAVLSQNSWNGVTLLGSGGSASSSAASVAADYAMPETATYSMDDAGGVATYSMKSAARAVDTTGSTNLLTSGNAESENTVSTDSAKIIYTANLSIETQDYDWSRQQLNDTLADVDGYMESSYEYTDSTDNTRTLSLTLRVPEGAYSAFLGVAENVVGNVVSKSETADDVTTQYLDLEARLDNLTAQRTRLQELQQSAENLSDLLEIESSLSDVQYQIESYQSQLNWYSQQVEYYTINITLNEVENLTSTDSSFGSKLSNALHSGWTNFVSGLQAVAIFLVGAWPAILIGAVCGVIFYFAKHPRKPKAAKRTSANEPPKKP